jgi:formate dehydrogenase subunit beta
MESSYVLGVKGKSVPDTVTGFLQELFEKEVVDYVLAPKEVGSGKNALQALVSKASDLEGVNPLAPVMPVSTARIVSAMTKVSPVPGKTGIVLRPCEARALIELVKLKQARLDNVLLVSFDCLGTYSMKDYESSAEEPLSFERTLGFVRKGEEDEGLRLSCLTCEHPIPYAVDLHIGLLGADLDKELVLTCLTPQGNEAAERLGLKKVETVPGRDEAVSSFVERRIKRRNEFFEKTAQETSGVDNFIGLFETCITCRNCKTVCPVCYCKECFFDSPTFEVEASKFIDWTRGRGSLRMPTDTILFHLTRLNHMGCSCVACGLCSDACPNEIPLIKVFKWGGFKVQEEFDYVPGRNLEEELPLSTFREDEMPELGTK